MPSDRSKPKIIRLFSSREIRLRIAALARKISRDYHGKQPTLLIVLEGGRAFGAALARRITLPVTVKTVSVSSYRGTKRKKVRILSSIPKSLIGQDVLVVDDILDSGHTLATLLKPLNRLRPKSVKTCVLLDKTTRAKKIARANYSGFSVPERFVVGYGLDYNGRYRDLPYVGYLEKPS